MLLETSYKMNLQAIGGQDQKKTTKFEKKPDTQQINQ